MTIERAPEIIPPPRRRAPTMEQAPLSDSAALLSAIEKAALNPQVDIGKVEQLLALYEGIEGRHGLQRGIDRGPGSHAPRGRPASPALIGTRR